MDLSIIIINWNSKRYLKECLKCLTVSANDPECEILVIDNASYDGSAQMVAEEFPGVIFIQSTFNLGFSGANNLAARQAKGNFLLFLNPDTVVVENALTKLIEVLRHMPYAGVVGAKLLNTDGTIQTSCVQSFPTIINQFLDCDLLRRCFPRSSLWGMEVLFCETHEPVSVEAISGACFMIERKTFERLGGFEERYFMYSEDIDMAFRVQQVGLKCYFVPAATVIHHGGSSSQKAHSSFSNVMLRESVYRFMRLHRSRFEAICFRFFIGIAALLRLPTVMAVCLFHQSQGADPSVRKWFSILRWSLGLESWAAKNRQRGFNFK